MSICKNTVEFKGWRWHDLNTIVVYASRRIDVPALDCDINDFLS